MAIRLTCRPTRRSLLVEALAHLWRLGERETVVDMLLGNGPDDLLANAAILDDLVTQFADAELWAEARAVLYQVHHTRLSRQLPPGIPHYDVTL